MAKKKPAPKAPSKPKASPPPKVPAPRPLRLEYRKPSELAENPANWRTHPDTQLLALGDVISEVGWAGAVLFNEATGRLIDGHARKEFAEAADEPIPVLIGSWTEAQERLILATLDPLASMAEADSKALEELLAGVETSSQAINAMLADLAKQHSIDLDPNPEPGSGGDEFDPTPEAEGPTRSQVGDLWLLGGKHRLLVGDATDEGNYERLVGGITADPVGLLVTDPPYNVAYTGKTKDALQIQNDSMSPEEFRCFLTNAFTNAFKYMRAGASFYIWHADLEGYNFRGAVQDCGQRVRQCLIWNKNTLVMGRQDYHWKHEPCLYGWKEGDSHAWHTDRKQTTVLEFDRPTASEDHPTMKPIALISYLIGNSSEKGQIVLDPFLGSGTTLIAAHRLGRVCYGMELEPRYADVILKRAEAEGMSAIKLEPQESNDDA